MKLQHYSLENSIDFDSSSIWTLVCENPTLFWTLIDDFANQIDGDEGKWVLADIKELDISKNIFLVTDYHGLGLNDKKSSNILQQKLKALAFDENHTLATHEISSQITKYLHELAQDIDFPICINDVDLAVILKSVSVSFLEEYTNLCEKLMDFVTLISRLTNIKILTFVNLRSYLSKEQLQALYKHCNQCDINVLCVENNYKFILPEEKILLCDDDLCEIFPNVL